MQPLSNYMLCFLYLTGNQVGLKTIGKDVSLVDYW